MAIKTRQPKKRGQSQALALKKLRNEAREEAVGTAVLVLLTYLHVDKGYNEEQLHDLFLGYFGFWNHVEKSGTANSELAEILKKECGFDIDKEIAAARAQDKAMGRTDV